MPPPGLIDPVPKRRRHETVSSGVSFAASGGTAPYTWEVESGSLPAGLELNASTGEVAWHTSAAGTFNFAVKVLDAAGQSFTRTRS